MVVTTSICGMLSGGVRNHIEVSKPRSRPKFGGGRQECFARRGHHQEQANRLPPAVAYGRRVLALHYFIRTRPELSHVRSEVLLWSLVGQIAFHGLKGDIPMTRAALTTFWTILRRENPFS